MEVGIILAVATGLSAWVVWWALQPPGGTREKAARPRRTFRLRFPTRPRKVTPAPAPRPIFQTTGPEPLSAGGDGFGVLPPGAPTAIDDRPPRSISLMRLALAIAFVAVLVVAALAVIGFLVKTQLDQYFTG